jgi:hypothetical protein
MLLWAGLSMGQTIICLQEKSPSYWMNLHPSIKNYILIPAYFLHMAVVIFQLIIMIIESRERLNSNLSTIRLYWIGNFFINVETLCYYLFNEDVDPMLVGKIVLTIKCAITIALSMMSIKWVRDYNIYSIKNAPVTMEYNRETIGGDLTKKLMEFPVMPSSDGISDFEGVFKKPKWFKLEVDPQIARKAMQDWYKILVFDDRRRRVSKIKKTYDDCLIFETEMRKALGDLDV